MIVVHVRGCDCVGVTVGICERVVMLVWRLVMCVGVITWAWSTGTRGHVVMWVWAWYASEHVGAVN